MFPTKELTIDGLFAIENGVYDYDWYEHSDKEKRTIPLEIAKISIAKEYGKCRFAACVTPTPGITNELVENHRNYSSPDIPQFCHAEYVARKWKQHFWLISRE